MSTDRTDRPTSSSATTREDELFLAKLRAHYRPAPLDGARRAALDADLRERIRRPRWSGGLAPALAAASVAVCALWVALPGGEAPTPDAGLRMAEAAETSASPWESRLFHGDVTGAEAAWDEGEPEPSLPADYAAIASVFIDD